MEFNRRREKRVPLEMITLPFLATREDDHQSFEYVLMDVSPSGVKFAIPKWVVSRERLTAGAIVNLHLPLLHEGASLEKGEVVWTKRDETLHAELCAVSMSERRPSHSPITISVENAGIVADMERIGSLPGFLVRIIRDAFLLKKGVSIYLKHLIPFFSRIGGYPEKEYPMLKDLLLSDIQNRVLANHDALQDLQRRIAELCAEPDDIPQLLDLEKFRSLIESEINPDIFTVTFESEGVRPYISSIKELEKKLYANFNMVVMVYLLSL